jgi:hypothetical protein
MSADTASPQRLLALLQETRSYDIYDCMNSTSASATSILPMARRFSAFCSVGSHLQTAERTALAAFGHGGQHPQA